jgi:hypothetical protein
MDAAMAFDGSYCTPKLFRSGMASRIFKNTSFSVRTREISKAILVMILHLRSHRARVPREQFLDAIHDPLDPFLDPDLKPLTTEHGRRGRPPTAG